MKNNKGFTLIELMIVVAIVGIISAIAFPSYNSYMNKSRRTDAKVGLTRMTDLQERYYLQNNTYTTVVGNVGGANTSEGYYTLSIDNADVNAFSLTADVEPTGPQKNDTDCLQFTITSIGVKTAAPDVAGLCW